MKKSLTENFIFCVVIQTYSICFQKILSNLKFMIFYKDDAKKVFLAPKCPKSYEVTLCKVSINLSFPIKNQWLEGDRICLLEF